MPRLIAARLLLLLLLLPRTGLKSNSNTMLKCIEMVREPFLIAKNIVD